MSGFCVPELIEMVIDQLVDDKRSLASCSTIAKVWLPRSRFHLFRTIQIVIRTPEWNLDKAVKFLASTPDIHGAVHHIHIRAAAIMRVPTAGLDELLGVWPIPLDSIDLRQLCALLQFFHQPVSLDMEGVFAAFDTAGSDFSTFIPALEAPSLRKLTMRDVLVPTIAFDSIFNLSRIFPQLYDLTLDNVLFNSSGVPEAAQNPHWGGDLKITQLLLRHVSGILYLLPNTAFRNVRKLNMSMLALLIPGAARFLTPLYDSLEELTLGEFLFVITEDHALIEAPEATGSFELSRYHHNAFELANCTRLHTLNLVQAGKFPVTNRVLARDFLIEVAACLLLAPQHLQHLTLAFLPCPDDEIMEDVTSSPPLLAVQRRIESGAFPQLKTIRVGSVLDQEYHPRRLGEESTFEPLAEKWQLAVRKQFQSEKYAEKLIF